MESKILLYEIHCNLYMNKKNAFINTVDYHWKIAEKLIHFSIFCLCSLHFSFQTLVPWSIHSYRHIKKNCSFWVKENRESYKYSWHPIALMQPIFCIQLHGLSFLRIIWEKHVSRKIVRGPRAKKSIRNWKAFVLRNKYNLLKININMTFCSIHHEHIILHQ